jgi:hypothetical protein
MPVRGGSLELGGFIDYRYQDAEDGESRYLFRPGNGVEVGLGYDLTDRASVIATFVSGGDDLALGPSFIDYHFRAEAGHPSHGARADESGFQIGLFDVPFGIESRKYSSVDRPSIAAPFITDRLFAGGWTDVGMHLYLGEPGENGLLGGRGQLSLYAVNGFQWDDGADAVFGTPDDAGLTLPLTASTNGRTLGGRFGCLIFPELEIGVSISSGDYRGNVSGAEPGMRLAGLDASWEFGRFSFRGEYVRFSGDVPGALDLDIRSWYCEPVYALAERVDIYARYDEIRYSFDVDGNGAVDDDLRSALGGLRFRVTDHVALRCEVERVRYEKTVIAKADALRAALVTDF